MSNRSFVFLETGRKPRIPTFRKSRFSGLGLHFGITTWEAPGGTTWTITHNEFPSPAAAQEYLDKQVAKALKIVKRSNVKDSSGKIVGKRVEVIVNARVKEGNRETPAVLRTNGAQFYIILSDSFQHISQFENAPFSRK